MGGNRNGVARLGLAGGGECAVGRPDTLAGMPVAHGPAAPGTVCGGGTPAGGRFRVHSVRDVPRGAHG